MTKGESDGMVSYMLNGEVDIENLARTLLYLSNDELIGLAKTIREKLRLSGNVPMPEEISVAALVGAVADKNETESMNKKLLVSEFFAKYDKMQQQHNEDEIWMEDVGERNKFYEEFFKYIADEAVGDKLKLVEMIPEQSRCWFEGYVKVTKRVDDRQRILLDFTVDGDKYTAEWQPCDNYAVWQTCGMCGDDYKGYLLLPTYKEDEYFLMYYIC